jgi:hypothetical protein
LLLVRSRAKRISKTLSHSTAMKKTVLKMKEQFLRERILKFLFVRARINGTLK